MGAEIMTPHSIANKVLISPCNAWNTTKAKSSACSQPQAKYSQADRLAIKVSSGYCSALQKQVDTRLLKPRTALQHH